MPAEGAAAQKGQVITSSGCTLWMHIRMARALAGKNKGGQVRPYALSVWILPELVRTIIAIPQNFSSQAAIFRMFIS